MVSTWIPVLQPHTLSLDSSCCGGPIVVAEDHIESPRAPETGTSGPTEAHISPEAAWELGSGIYEMQGALHPQREHLDR